MLLSPVEVVDARDVGPVHFIAAGGSGMSGVARLYAELGVPTTGSDQSDSRALRSLERVGVRTWVGHDVGHLGDAETVVISSAIREDNVELAEARRRGLRVWHRSAALAALMLGRRGVAIAGTHGKTTTTAMTRLQYGPLPSVSFSTAICKAEQAGAAAGRAGKRPVPSGTLLRTGVSTRL